MPLHAAGVYPNGPSCSEHFVSSFAPTLSALTRAQKASQEPPLIKSTRLLLASVEHTAYPGAGDLPGTVQEISIIQDLLGGEHPLLPDPANMVVMQGAQSQALQKELPQAAVLHLASHGVQDDMDPLQSGFLMADQKLSIQDLMNLNLPNAYLAVLSACHTAKGDAKQPDQTVHLAATMLFVGFKSVVATMW